MLHEGLREGSPTVWVLYALGFLYVVGFVSFWFRFRAGEIAARGGDPEAVFRFNASLRGFPNKFYAKMLGKRPFEVTAAEGGPDALATSKKT